jgi:hypothetical protein
MTKIIVSGTDENGVSIQVNGDIVDIVMWCDYNEIHTETVTLKRFKEELGL